MVNASDWDRFAENYGAEVLSLTQFPAMRNRLVQAVPEGARVLIVGCGSATHLQEQLIAERRVDILASDFSKRMIEVAADHFTNPHISYQQLDTKHLPFQNEFDVAITTNSVIPETRPEVVEMFASLHGALKTQGTLLGILSSFEGVEQLTQRFPGIYEHFLIDSEDARVWDTTGWQCFHTRETLRQELGAAGFSAEVSLETLHVEEAAQVDALKRLYGLSPVQAAHVMWHFFKAQKTAA